MSKVYQKMRLVRMVMGCGMLSGAIVFSGCGSNPTTTSTAGAGIGRTVAGTPSGGRSETDIRNKVAPFYNEQYMKVSDRFKARRERLLKALTAQ